MRPRLRFQVLGRVSTALMGIVLLGGFAEAQLPSSILPAPPIPVLAPSAPIADKPIGVPAGGCPWTASDGGTQFGVDLLLGQFTGLRGQAVVYHTGDEGVFVVEAFYGAILDRLGSGEGVGGGGRYYLRRSDRSGENSLLIGPGLGFYYQSRDDVWMAAPTLDLAWVHAIGDKAAWEIGLNAGLGVGLNNGQRWCYERNDAGQVTPLFSLFTGFRF